jgi:hypothetical protein
LDRYLAVTLFILLLNFSGSFVNTWGLGTTIQSNITPNTIAVNAGCNIYTNGTVNCARSASGLSFFGSAFFQFVLFVGDWLGALVSFIKTFALGVIFPQQWLTRYSLPNGFVQIVSGGIYIDYFFAVILWLRGGRAD